jgi:putative FmdB family regulatory protein
MPIYEYLCKNCGYELEELQSIKEPPLVKCPSCGKSTLVRLIGTGSGVIFKGSGFYHTDYKKSASPNKTTAGTSSKKETQSETKAESKPASQPDKKADKKESKKN